MIATVLIIFGFRAGAQGNDTRHHDGFYFSLGLGPSFGHVDSKNTYASDYQREYRSEYYGTPFVFDLRIGGAIRKDLVLTFDMVGRSMSGPQLKTDSGTYMTSDDFSFSENTYGVGITRFFMPLNVYVGATLGTGIFVYNFDSDNDELSTSLRSKGGFSWMLRAGKSWYLGRKWGLGIGMGFGNTTTHTQISGDTEDLSSGQIMGTVTVSYQ